MGQPIVDGIQAVGSVTITYKYNASNGQLNIPTTFKDAGKRGAFIDTKAGINLAGFRLDSEFLRATPMMASSFMTALLGGGAVALTNNIRAGTFSLNCTKCAAPVFSAKDTNGWGFSATDEGAGNEGIFYDFVFIAQCQQATPGGDSVGATIEASFEFKGVTTKLIFEGCTIATVDPIALAGNDLPNYNVSVNYTRWKMDIGAVPTAPAA
jgi:hypothetical protein